jgi:hypothetical protein
MAVVPHNGDKGRQAWHANPLHTGKENYLFCGLVLIWFSDIQNLTFFVFKEK